MDLRINAARLAFACALLSGSPAALALSMASVVHADELAASKSVPSATLDALDLSAVAREDVKRDVAGLPPRYAVPKKSSVRPTTHGLWETARDGMAVWRYRISAPDALSLNFGFKQFKLPQGASLWIYSADRAQLHGPFTADDNEAHGEFWSPIVLGGEAVIELSVPVEQRDEVVLTLTQIGHGYRAFGSGLAEKTGRRAVPFAGVAADTNVACEVSPVEPATHAQAGDVIGFSGNKSAEKSGSCNMDFECLLADDPWRETARAVAVISTGGSTFCTGSLVNNTSNDRRMLFVTARHCDVSGQAASVVAYWNYQNSTCRLPGSAASGSAGDGSLAVFNTGAIFLASYPPSDFVLLELDDPAPAAANVFWAGWDRTPYSAPGGPGFGDHACSAGVPCLAIHHADNEEKRITFVVRDFETTNFQTLELNTHFRAFWDPTPVFPPNPAQNIPAQATGVGASGSPLYNASRRFVGQLHGGPSVCGATGDDLSDFYGRFSESFKVTPVFLDPDNTGLFAIDGVSSCTAPPAPTGIVSTATGPNRIELTWNPVAGATYRVIRSDGACPGSVPTVIADGLSSPSYADTSVSGDSLYTYRVMAVVGDCPSTKSQCSEEWAEGACALPPTFAGVVGADNAGTAQCSVRVSWNAAASNCGGTPTYTVFRSVTPGFTPGAGNRIATCVSGTDFDDLVVAPGTTYHYRVRAEESNGSGTGFCNAGTVDSNAVSLPAMASQLVATFADDVESGATDFVVNGTGGEDFAIVTTDAHSPTRSWFVPNLDADMDRRLEFGNPVTPVVNSVLSFWHREATEGGYDGLVLEYSTDGTNWFDILAGNDGSVAPNPNRFPAGAYGQAIDGGPLNLRQAWSGFSGFTETRVALADFAGLAVRFRFRFVSDSQISFTGVWIDDIAIQAESACSLLEPVFENGFE